MRLPRPRFSIRWMMVAVALLAMILGAELTRRRWLSFRERARFYAGMEDIDRFLLEGGMMVVRRGHGPVSQVHGPLFTREVFEGGGWVETRMEGSPGYEASILGRRTEYHASLRRKYERAARYPWLPVSPDPSEPE